MLECRKIVTNAKSTHIYFMSKGNDSKPRTSPEFWLVVTMLVILTILVIVVLFAGISFPSGTASPDAKELLDYRKGIMTIIITAFGAWVSAGAAYFFGRENMRMTTESLLKMHQSPAERFKQMPVRNLPRKPIDWVVKAADTLDTITTKINRKQRWFIPIVKEDGSLENVIHEDAVWIFISDKGAEGMAHADIIKKTIADVVTHIRSKPEYKEFDMIYVPVGLEDKAGEVHDIMLRKDIYLAVVTDSKGNPKEFLTTADMRIFLLQTP